MKLLLSSIIIILIISFYGCNLNGECLTYECRRQNIEIKLSPKLIDLGESTELIIKRKKFYLPHFRVYLGEYDENFNLPEGVEERFIEDSDSIASIYLSPESPGEKIIRGIVEEYVLVTKDSADTYRYPFEIVLTVE